MAIAAHITHSLKLFKYCTHGDYNLAHLTVFIATDAFEGFIFANLLMRQFLNLCLWKPSICVLILYTKIQSRLFRIPLCYVYYQCNMISKTIAQNKLYSSPIILELRMQIFGWVICMHDRRMNVCKNVMT